MMAMSQITNLAIPANGQVRFAPGGLHLMLNGPRQRLTAGRVVNMTLVFDSSVKQTVSVSVAAR